MAEWLWPQSEDFIHIRLSMADVGLDREEREGGEEEEEDVEEEEEGQIFSEVGGQTDDQGDLDSGTWMGIGFSRGSRMSDGIDATLVFAGSRRAHVKSFHLGWYDSPEPGSERDLLALGQLDFLEYSEGYVSVGFRKRAGRNALPYVSGAGVDRTWRMKKKLLSIVSPHSFINYLRQLAAKDKYYLTLILSGTAYPNASNPLIGWHTNRPTCTQDSTSPKQNYRRVSPFSI